MTMKRSLARRWSFSLLLSAYCLVLTADSSWAANVSVATATPSETDAIPAKAVEVPHQCFPKFAKANLVRRPKKSGQQLARKSPPHNKEEER